MPVSKKPTILLKSLGATLLILYGRDKSLCNTLALA